MSFERKAYWRATTVFTPARGEERLRPRRGGWHCFIPIQAHGAPRQWISLCDANVTLDRAYGQEGRRPPLFLRCPACEAKEDRIHQGRKRPDLVTLKVSETYPVYATVLLHPLNLTWLTTPDSEVP